MNIESLDLGSSLTVGGIFSAVLLVFTGIEKIQSPKNKAVVADWIRSGNLTEVVGLSDNVRQLFSSLFGSNHFSITCIVRSVSLSLTIDLIVLLFWLIHYKEFSHFVADLEAVKGYWKFLILTMCASVIVDYFMLFKTRWIIANLRLTSSVIGGSLAIIADVCATVLTFFAIQWLVVSFIIWMHSLPVLGKFWTLSDIISMPIDILFGGGFDKAFPYSVLFVSCLLTSLWLWLYIASANFLRIVCKVVLVARWLSAIVDLDNHPVQILGILSSLICSTLYLVILMFRTIVV
jgi:hypothetical protein